MNKTMRHSRLLLVAILILSGSGVWLSGEMLKQHDNIWGESGTGFLAQICDATKQWGFNCDSAAKGAWASVRLPMLSWSGTEYAYLTTIDVPVAFMGLAYFVFFAVWFAFVGRPRVHGRRWFYLPIAAAAMGGVGSIGFISLMALKIAPLCSACLTVHGINFMMITAVGWLCIPAIRAKKTDETTITALPRPAQMTLTTREAFGAIAFSLVLIAGLWQYRSEHLALGDQLHNLVPYKAVVNKLRDDRTFLLREYYAQPAQTVAAEGSEILVDELPQLDVFIDYECPGCACRTKDIIANAMLAFGKPLQVVIRHFPLCHSCNPTVETEFHKHACLAAYAAEAARMQGGKESFWKMNDQLMRYPGVLDLENLCTIAEQLGLDMERFVKDLDSDAVRQAVASHVALGQQWNVTGTPTLFINGRRVNKDFEGPTYWQVVAEDWSQRHGTQLTSAFPLEKLPSCGKRSGHQ